MSRVNFHNASIRQKLILVIVLVSVVVMLLVAGALLAVEVVSFRQSLVDKTAALAQVLAVNSRQGLMLNQKSQVEDVLASLASEPHVRAAFVFRSGKPFAYYLNAHGSFQDRVTALSYSPCKLLDQAPRAIRVSYHFSSSHLAYLLPIFLDQQLLGQLYIQFDLGELNSRLAQFGSALLVLLLLSGLLSVLLASRLQRVVTEPLIDLSEVMERVADRGDFKLRARPRHPDEIGMLVRRFNTMLEQLEERDQQLQGYRQNLEQLVRQRTLELSETNDRLQQSVADLAEARDRAEAANRAKSQFLANMSHEIRTPMIGVLGMTELLFNTGLNEKQQQLAQTVFNSGEALLEILNDLLDLSKIEAGKLVLTEEDFDLGESLEEVVELFSETAARKGLHLGCELPPELPVLLRGDAGRLRQILLNLVGNAVKFTERGDVRIRVAALEQDSSSVYLRFEVEDTGIGIDPLLQGRIFDSFAQASEAMNRKFVGTGLGLAIVRQLVGLMAGEVGVESTPGVGSCFWFEISLRRQPRHSVKPDLITEQLRGGRLLIVDDDQHAVDILTDKLAACGFEVEHAVNGREALAMLAEAADQNPFVAAFLDSDMAGLGGKRLAAAISSQARFRETRLVMMCEQGNLSLSDDGCGPNIHRLYKPIRSVQLVKTLNELLQIQSPPPETALSPDLPRMQLPPGWRVLLVEDNPTTRDFVQRILADEDGRLLIAHQGEEALELLEEQRVDLVLMDCQMPIVDGYEATRRLRQKGLSIPIIALTANAFPEDIAACHDAGMDDHLCKPFRREDLLLVLQRWLGEMDETAAVEEGV